MFVLCSADADQSHKWQDPKFPTECFFFAVQCHHISIIPVLRKYQRVLRAIRELKHMIDELDIADLASVGYVDQQRRKLVLERWRSQLSVSYVHVLYASSTLRLWLVSLPRGSWG